MPVAIQGGPASFHDAAAQLYFRETVPLVCCESFRQVCAELRDGTASAALMAIENVIAGGILTNYALLQEFPLAIVGEVNLPVGQQLMALPGQTLADIRTVRSHPMALRQCSRLLASHPAWKLIESNDTAESARQIRERAERGVAALAGAAAAERYGLAVLLPDVADHPQNYTRFLVLRRRADCPAAPPAGANKASVTLGLRHTTGALARVLDVFAVRSINLSLIQSIPILAPPTEITILVDLEWDDLGTLEAALRAVSPLTERVHVLGTYQKSHDYSPRPTA